MPPATSIAVPTTYLSLAGVLSFLVLLTLWRETKLVPGRMFFPRSFAALAFVISRLLVVVFSGAIVAGPVFPPVVYMALNFACVFLLAYSMHETVRATIQAVQQARGDIDAEDDDSTAEDNAAANRAVLKTLRSHALIWGAVGLLGYWVVPHPGNSGYSVAGLVDATEDPSTEAARKAILDNVLASCGTTVAEANAVQAKHSAGFMTSKPCLKGAIGGAFAKTMKV